MIGTVTLFARARDLAGNSTIQVELSENATVQDLRNALRKQFPELTPLLPHLLIAVNETYAGDEVAIPKNATLACFPPVSGG